MTIILQMHNTYSRAMLHALIECCLFGARMCICTGAQAMTEIIIIIITITIIISSVCF